MEGCPASSAGPVSLGCCSMGLTTGEASPLGVPHAHATNMASDGGARLADMRPGIEAVDIAATATATASKVGSVKEDGKSVDGTSMRTPAATFLALESTRAVTLNGKPSNMHGRRVPRA
ncbi:hypothetical protein B0T26DRAFT_670715 [Lasiosphaeria miniovina]|uniref:Uncharacterized protein n=1 Tax=Lasiosphaeria miniovina TaxID=1954250 RepID=A0AA40BHS0_9PEZI|nr:uncharacterized protein B0T26DRAFT_670715 [Lasiosphaeria miniovina]KAK0734414.1 hypothetical protein B0T26DRAFT_670715 [Lasiosphaeria miniovina]